MKKTAWITAIVLAGSVAAFLWLDGPLRLHRRTHEGEVVDGGQRPGEDRWTEERVVAAAAQKIVALTLERTGCYGTCPVYTVRFERNRNAVYDGKEFVTREGRFTGKFYGFERLAYFAAARLLALKDDYQILVTDHSTTILTIEMTDGTKRISDYANAGPNDLSIFCTTLDGVASSIHWEPEKKANQVPEPTSGLAPGRGSS
jgi:hypothetical protein